MARVWPPDPEIPAPGILRLAKQVADAAHDLFRTANHVSDHRAMALAEDLFAWSATLERMAISSPTYHAALAQSFSDHPRHGEAIDDRLIPHRATADLLAFFGIGDLVLNQLGRLWMRQLNAPIPGGDDGFAALLKACDGDVTDDVVRPTRRLQVGLRAARNRFLAHARPDHAKVGGWAIDETPDVTLVGMADPGLKRIAAERLNARLSRPYEATVVAHPRSFVEAVIAAAADLSSDELYEVDRAGRTVGYSSPSIADVVDDVLALVRGIRAVGREDLPEVVSHVTFGDAD